MVEATDATTVVFSELLKARLEKRVDGIIEIEKPFRLKWFNIEWNWQPA